MYLLFQEVKIKLCRFWFVMRIIWKRALLSTYPFSYFCVFVGSQSDEFIPAVEEKGENAAAALIARRRDIGICSRRDYIVSRSQCRLQLRHECASSSDCSFGFRCCFNGCVNACVRWSFLDLAPSDDPFFYRKKKK